MGFLQKTKGFQTSLFAQQETSARVKTWAIQTSKWEAISARYIWGCLPCAPDRGHCHLTCQAEGRTLKIPIAVLVDSLDGHQPYVALLKLSSKVACQIDMDESRMHDHSDQEHVVDIENESRAPVGT